MIDSERPDPRSDWWYPPTGLRAINPKLLDMAQRGHWWRLLTMRRADAQIKADHEGSTEYGLCFHDLI